MIHGIFFVLEVFGDIDGVRSPLLSSPTLFDVRRHVRVLSRSRGVVIYAGPFT